MRVSTFLIVICAIFVYGHVIKQACTFSMGINIGAGKYLILLFRSNIKKYSWYRWSQVRISQRTIITSSIFPFLSIFLQMHFLSKIARYANSKIYYIRSLTQSSTHSEKKLQKLVRSILNLGQFSFLRKIKIKYTYSILVLIFTNLKFFFKC